MTKKKVFPKEVLINSLIAAGLVFFGGILSGHVSWEIIIGCIAAAFIACLTRLKAYLDDNPTPRTKTMFNFII